MAAKSAPRGSLRCGTKERLKWRLWLDETFHEIAEHVLPVFHRSAAKVTAPAEEICNA